ncbi:hypothetical protein [Roseixanthobacter pseudopolyaromaticivorans]|jgi:hypothetical protein|uniref:hypothetical protein n=1 Tax=Xanthobacteraceae TaxID=335928 RepID=UPI003727F837
MSADPSDLGLHRDLGRLEGKVDSIAETAERIETRLASQDERIATLERRQWYITGAAAAVAWIASSFLDLRAILSRIV